MQVFFHSQSAFLRWQGQMEINLDTQFFLRIALIYYGQSVRLYLQ